MSDDEFGDAMEGLFHETAQAHILRNSGAVEWFWCLPCVRRFKALLRTLAASVGTPPT